MDGFRGVKQRHAEYLAKAQDAQERAEKTVDSSARKAWLELAENWRTMAEQVMRLSK